MSDSIERLAGLITEQLARLVDVGRCTDSAIASDIERANVFARALHDAAIRRRTLQPCESDQLINELADRLFQRLQVRQAISIAIKNQRKRISLVQLRGRQARTWSACSAGRAARRANGL